VAHAGAGLIVGLLMFLPVFWLGGMGGGDVKLLSALGAWIGPGPALWMAAFTALAGGPLAVLVAVWHGYARTMMENVRSLLTFWRVAGVRPHPVLTLETGSAPRLPYAIAIAAGLIATLWFR
jgi:prepilin peptidase CpaA